MFSVLNVSFVVAAYVAAYFGLRNDLAPSLQARPYKDKRRAEMERAVRDQIPLRIPYPPASRAAVPIWPEMGGLPEQGQIEHSGEDNPDQESSEGHQSLGA